MGRGSYRGGSTSVGWNANSYVAPSLTGRTRKGRALIKDLATRTAQSRAEQAGQDEHARKRHGLRPKAKPAPPAAMASTGASGLATEARRRLKAKAGSAFTVTVVKRKRRAVKPRS